MLSLASVLNLLFLSLWLNIEDLKKILFLYIYFHFHHFLNCRKVIYTDKLYPNLCPRIILSELSLMSLMLSHLFLTSQLTDSSS